jgi:hypothetical protein
VGLAVFPFTTQMSHDVRISLNAIEGFTQVYSFSMALRFLLLLLLPLTLTPLLLLS